MDDNTSQPESDSVDEYMRHVGRTLYEIISDWRKEQQALKAGTPRPPALTNRVSEEGGSK